MIIDKELELSDGQAITADAASTNVIDLGQTADVAPGVPLQVRFQVDTALSGGTFSALTVKLQCDTVENFASATDLPTVSSATGEVHLSQDLSRVLNLSDRRAQKTGDSYISSEQYIRLYYDVDNNPTAGAVSAFVEVYQAPEGDIGNIPGNL